MFSFLRERGREKEKDRGSHRDEELNRLPRGVVEVPSLEIAKKHTHVALRDVVWCRGGDGWRLP